MQNKITGWKRNYPVKEHPDFVCLAKMTVFAEGFLHGHDFALQKGIGRKKLKRNKKYDQEVTALFDARGWTLLKMWECVLKKKNENALIERIRTIMR